MDVRAIGISTLFGKMSYFIKYIFYASACLRYSDFSCSWIIDHNPAVF